MYFQLLLVVVACTGVLAAHDEHEFHSQLVSVSQTRFDAYKKREFESELRVQRDVAKVIKQVDELLCPLALQVHMNLSDVLKEYEHYKTCLEPSQARDLIISSHGKQGHVPSFGEFLQKKTFCLQYLQQAPAMLRAIAQHKPHRVRQEILKIADNFEWNSKFLEDESGAAGVNFIGGITRNQLNVPTKKYIDVKDQIASLPHVITTISRGKCAPASSHEIRQDYHLLHANAVRLITDLLDCPGEAVSEQITRQRSLTAMLLALATTNRAAFATILSSLSEYDELRGALAHTERGREFIATYDRNVVFFDGQIANIKSMAHQAAASGNFLMAIAYAQQAQEMTSSLRDIQKVMRLSFVLAGRDKTMYEAIDTLPSIVSASMILGFQVPIWYDHRIFCADSDVSWLDRLRGYAAFVLRPRNADEVFEASIENFLKEIRNCMTLHAEGDAEELR